MQHLHKHKKNHSKIQGCAWRYHEKQKIKTTYQTKNCKLFTPPH